ncbi:MAG: hypothetical protein ABSG86_18855 [Thermoguttaceae bacterium]
MTNEAHEVQPTPTAPAVYPKQVRAAGLILVVQGGLVLLAVVGIMAWSVWLEVKNPAMGAVCCDWWLLLFPALPGYLLLRVGQSFMTGAAKGTAAFGVLFFILGVPVGLVATLFFVRGLWDLFVGIRGMSPIPPWGVILGGSIGLLVALGLAGSGVMLFAGRRPYRAWKQAARLMPGGGVDLGRQKQ